MDLKNNRLILLLTPPTESHRTAEENLGLGYLATALRNHAFRVIIKDCWLQKISIASILELVKEELDDLLFIGISCYRSNIASTFNLAREIKSINHSINIIVGGFGPTFYVDDFISNVNIDIVVKGEAEETVLQIANNLQTNNINGLKDVHGITYKEDGIIKHNIHRKHVSNIDTISFPSRDTIEDVLRRKSTVNVLSSRGCMASCIFCSIIAFQKLGNNEKWRERSISNFVDEIEFLHRNYNVNFFKVIDDSLIEFPRDVEWCKSLSYELERRSLSVNFRGSVRADRVSDEILYYLRKAGFISFSCGIENGSATALKRMGKSASVADNIMALKLFEKHKIFVQAGMILFDDKTTLQELWDNYNFLNTYKWSITKGIFTEMFAAEGTPFTLKLKKNKNLVSEATLRNGNSTYKMENSLIENVYSALKFWHKSHAFIYDMVIDPLSAPKALLFEELMCFYEVYSVLREKDLEFFKLILDNVTSMNNDELMRITKKMIFESEIFYAKVTSDCKHLYEKFQLVYDAQENPFIC